jgi:hypothetical protein
VTAVGNIPPREGRAVTIAGREIAICPLHTWKINLKSGAVETPSAVTACVETYPARVDKRRGRDRVPRRGRRYGCGRRGMTPPVPRRLGPSRSIDEHERRRRDGVT